MRKNSLDEKKEDYFFETYGLRILRALRRIIRAVDIHSRKLNNEYNITAPQMICLYSLAGQEEMTLSALAREVNLGMSTVNGIVDRLESKKMLTRTRSDKDRRKVILEITEAGLEVVRASPPLLQKRFSEALRSLPELEQATIALSLEQVVKLMGADQIDASPHLMPEAQPK